MKYILTTLMAVFFFLMPKMAFAQYYSQGSNNYSIVIDKKVKSGSMSTFLDNIPASTFVFQDGGTIEFSVLVQNSGNQDLTSITVKDILPANLSLQYYPGTLYNNTLTWNIDRLSPGEQRVFSIRALIKVNDSVGKQVNYVEASANGVSDNDSTVYYIEKAKVPVTGSNDLVIKTVVVLMFVSGGLLLRKVARGY